MIDMFCIWVGYSSANPSTSSPQSVDWLRKNKPSPNTGTTPYLETLTSLNRTPLPRQLSPEAKQKVIDDTMIG